MYENLCEPAGQVPRVAFVEVRQSIPSQDAAVSAATDQLMLFIRKFSPHRMAETRTDEELRTALLDSLSKIVSRKDDSAPTIAVRCRCSLNGDTRIAMRRGEAGLEVISSPPTNQTGKSVVAIGNWIS